MAPSKMEIDITLSIPAEKAIISPVRVKSCGDGHYELRESVFGHEDFGLVPEAVIECRRDLDVDAAVAGPLDSGDRPPGYTLVGIVRASSLHMYQCAVPRDFAESSLLAGWMQRLIEEGCYVFRDMDGILSVYTRESGRDISAEIDAMLAEFNATDQEPAK